MVPPEKTAKSQRSSCFRPLSTEPYFTSILGPGCPQVPWSPKQVSHRWGSGLRATFPSQEPLLSPILVPATCGLENLFAESQRTRGGEVGSLSPLPGLKFTGYGTLSFLTCGMETQSRSLWVLARHNELADCEPPWGSCCWHQPYPVKVRDGGQRERKDQRRK